MDLVRFLVICVLGLIGGTAVFAVIVSLLPPYNPLRQLLSAVVYRLCATAAVMVVDVPALGVPVVGEVFDVATWIWLIWYWFGLIRDAKLALGTPATPTWHTVDEPPPVTDRLRHGRFD